jgi:hypothetical protein
MIAQTHRRGAPDPTLVAEIRRRKAALAAARPAPRQVVRPPVVAPSPAPPPAADPPMVRNALPMIVDPFGPAAAGAIFDARKRVEHDWAVARLRALAPPAEPRAPSPAPGPAPGWPDPADVYERRKADVRRAAQQRRG